MVYIKDRSCGHAWSTRRSKKEK